MSNIKADSDKQTKRINFRLTGLEYEKLTQSATTYGLNTQIRVKKGENRYKRWYNKVCGGFGRCNFFSSSGVIFLAFFSVIFFSLYDILAHERV
ncbi:hypothetical protein ABMB44_14440 [Levilactobacillus brevis]